METRVWASAADITDFAQGSSSGFNNRDRGGGRDREREGGGICCHGERFFKQLLICSCCSAPLSILLLSLSPLCYRQPFRQEICTLRGRLWTFLLQTFYAVRHTQGWETLSCKHRERILAGKEGYPCYELYSHTQDIHGAVCVDVCGVFFVFFPP